MLHSRFRHLTAVLTAAAIFGASASAATAGNDLVIKKQLLKAERAGAAEVPQATEKVVGAPTPNLPAATEKTFDAMAKAPNGRRILPPPGAPKLPQATEKLVGALKPKLPEAADRLLEKSKAIVLAKRADLIVETLVLVVYKPGDVLPGAGGVAQHEMWTMGWRIRNIGAAPVEGGLVAVKCKPKSLLPCPPALAAEYSFGYLVPDSWVGSPVALLGSTYSVGPVDPFPAPDILAQFEFTVTVDPTFQIPEANEANNTLITQFNSATYGSRL